MPDEPTKVTSDHDALVTASQLVAWHHQMLDLHQQALEDLKAAVADHQQLHKLHVQRIEMLECAIEGIELREKGRR